jgi:hypothetical protein
VSHLRRWTLVLLATSWAMCLVVLGLWLIGEGSRWFALPAGLCRSAGAAAVTGGLFVFMVFVADRVVPGVGRRQRMWPVEMAVLLLMVTSLAGVLVSFRGTLT